MSAPLVTPDGGYIVVRGQLWRRSNPNISSGIRQCFVDVLMAALAHSSSRCVHSAKLSPPHTGTRHLGRIVR